MSDDPIKPLAGFGVRSPDAPRSNHLDVRKFLYWAWYVAGAIAIVCLAPFVIAQVTDNSISRFGIAMMVAAIALGGLIMLFPLAYFPRGVINPQVQRLRDLVWTLEIICGAGAIYFLAAFAVAMRGGIFDIEGEYVAPAVQPGTWQHWWHYDFELWVFCIFASVVVSIPSGIYFYRRFGFEAPPRSIPAILVAYVPRIVSVALAAQILLFVTDMLSAPAVFVPDTEQRAYLKEDQVLPLIVALCALGTSLAAFAVLWGPLRGYTAIVAWLIFVAAMWSMLLPFDNTYQLIWSFTVCMAIFDAPIWLYLTRRYWMPHLFKLNGRS